MKTKYFIFAASALVALASCSNDEYIGDNSLTTPEGDGSIQFSYSMPNATRADIYGDAAATLLGSNFYVMGTKGTEAATYPTSTLVFDNYLVHYSANSAGKTESNTANWEYVGIQPGTDPYDNYAFLSSMDPERTEDAQTIKFWDYSVPQYHFYAFSTGTYAAIEGSSTSASNIGVTHMAYGSTLASSATAYTFDLPSVAALQKTYITDIVEVNRDVEGYGKEVQLKFKNLGAKVRMAIYETVPGYSVKNVVFYTEDGTDITGAKTTAEQGAALISADANGIPQKGQIRVCFPHVGTDYQPGGTSPQADYNKASATLVPPAAGEGNYKKAPTFGPLAADKLAAKQKYEVGDDNVFLGRTLPSATYAGVKNVDYYQAVFPVSTPSTLTLRVDYTLVPIDGTDAPIIVKGAKAVVPSEYTKWQPNYAYTYIFKISDNSNGWTGAADKPSGLFPITFDAVVTEVTDATGKQATVTTVATPSITTYQQNHDITKNEYSKGTGKNIYVRVVDNRTATATPVGATACTLPALSNTTSFFYLVDDDHATATEALVEDALENRTTAIDADNVTGRNGVTLTKQSITNAVTTIVNGPDNNPISLTVATDGHAAEIANGTLTAGKTYAYVYDYTNAAKTTTDIYQPISTTASTVIKTTEKYVTTDDLDDIDTSVAANVTAEDEAVDEDFIYFSKTKNGTSDWTYSFVSVDGKATLPAGLVKCPVTSLTDGDGIKTVETADAAFVFTIYTHNTGKYAVKVIKVVA